MARHPETVEKVKRALELRLQGWQYAAIGADLGVSMQRAWTMVQEAMADSVREPADKLRELEVARLDSLTAKLMPRALGETDDPPIDQDRAVLRIVQISDRRAKLLGLDAPVEIVVTETPEERAARIAERWRTFKAGDAIDTTTRELPPGEVNGNGKRAS